MHSYQIKPFPQYVLRTPAFPLSFYLNLLEDCSSETLLQSYENPFVREAIQLASPELVSALDNWKENPTRLSDEKKKVLEISLLKYLARISSRCTPFGLFAGCAVGGITSETRIVLEKKENFTRFTQFDMHFWVAMLQELTMRNDVKNHFVYYPNNSIYAIGDFYRYVEYQYVKTKREHRISALRKSELLDALLAKSKSGMTIDEMVLFLADDDSETEDASNFINQLVDFQFLVSELEATVTGSDEWERVLTILNKIPVLNEVCESLKTSQNQFVHLDKKVIASEETYEAIKSLIRQNGFEYDEKYLFQTDLNLTTSENRLSSEVPKKVLQALTFLNGIQKKRQSANQERFIKAFTQRYESREMPLTTVLDTEVGIGYLQNSDMNDSHGLLENFSFKRKIEEESNQIWTNNDYILQGKLQEAILKNASSISLSEKDFPDFEANWNDVPATFSVMIELIKTGENEKVSIVSSGDSSAAKLLGRFCNGNKDIMDLTTQIIDKETEYHTDKILAEIVHIPESRTGNILRRPVLREYEIAYLSNSGVENDSRIELTDMMISIKNGSIFLRSKKYNKEVIPCLSNAHNYFNKSLPIYHFLCDLQSQNVKPVCGFSWGGLESHYDFFPRVNYGEVILSKARWMLSKNEIEQFSKNGTTKII